MKFNAILADIRETVFLVIDLKDVTIKIQDGDTPTPNEINIKIGEGNLTYDENRNVEYILDRGRLDEVRLGDEVPVDVTFDFVWEFLTGNTSTTTNLPTVEDALKRQGNASVWVSTDPDGCRPFSVDIILENVPSCTSFGQEQEFITLSDFRYDTLSHDLRAATVACTGRCNVTEAAIVRSDQPSP